MGIKILHRGSLEWHYLRTKFHENLPCGSKFISGGTQTDTHTNRQIGGFMNSSRLLRVNIILTCIMDIGEDGLRE
jgi:hypothetical protein